MWQWHPNGQFLLLIIFVQKIIIRNFFWGRTFLIVNRFSKFLQHVLGQTLIVKFCKENILPKIELDRKYVRNTIIRGKLSETRNRTSVFVYVFMSHNYLLFFMCDGTVRYKR